MECERLEGAMRASEHTDMLAEQHTVILLQGRDSLCSSNPDTQC